VAELCFVQTGPEFWESAIRAGRMSDSEVEIWLQRSVFLFRFPQCRLWDRGAASDPECNFRRNWESHGRRENLASNSRQHL